MHRRHLDVLFIAGLFILTVVFLPLRSASAVLLTNRSVQISSAIASATVSHNFQFTYVSAGNVGSVVLEYCDNSPLFNVACNPPPGLDVSTANLTSQSGNVGFSIDAVNTTATKLVLTRPSIPSFAVASQYNFSNITNPSTPDHTVFIRLSTYASIDGSGPLTDYGAVAFATISPFSVNTFVPPFIRICVGITISIDCSASSGDRVDLGTLTPAAARSGQSQFSAGTNSNSGYVVFILGSTLTSGNNIINASTSPSPSFPGNRQFGINLRANLIPPVGADPAGPGSATPTANYNLPNLFTLNSGDAVVTDGIPSDYNRMTVSYLANINSSQPPGVYNTTFTYLATGDF